MAVSVKPVAGDDYLTFFENEAIGANLLVNDTAGANGNKFLRFFDNISVGAKTAGQTTAIAGDYGTFFVKADGSFTYELSAASKAGFFAGMTLTENLSYKISDGSGNTDVATFSMDIKGVTVKPVAVDDNFSFAENDVIGGNVLTNDIAGETGVLYLRSVEGTGVGAKIAGQVTDVAGEFGVFHFKADGSFTYDLNATVKAGLDAGETVTEKLEYYKISDGQGHTDVGILTVTIDGVTDSSTKTQVLLDFEDFDLSSNTEATATAPLPADYHGFSLTGPSDPVYVVDEGLYPTSGYAAGSVNPGENVALGWFARSPIVIKQTDGADFDFDSMYLTSAWDSAQTVHLEGKQDGAVLYSLDVAINNIAATFVDVDWSGIDELTISHPGQHIAMDNISLFVGDVPLV
ncbi:Ig-like domain-containing protein [Sphingobium sp. KCTC 72723]|uniref:Ig-like domain-containing protein n=1 Tax=Sphingobium sp. KCTC 72723 TaxID=2733867 RepID=UPI00165E8250|nr:Ig-like domain-containing protein [Sphingobium sp. KCTC 72723]